MSTWINRNEHRGSGLAVAVKDLIDVAGLPTTAASRSVADFAEAAAADAPCLGGLRDAESRGQAYVAGKTNLHELAYGITGVNLFTGTPINPLDPKRVPGGSSSGSAVAVATGQADVAYGTDTGGSVRIPSACCGTTGLKTTWGRIPTAGVVAMSPSFDTIGPMARDVAGTLRGMQLLEPGFEIAFEVPLRLGRLRFGARPEIEQGVDQALSAAELDLQEVDLGDLRPMSQHAGVLLAHEAAVTNAERMRLHPDLIGEDVLAKLTAGAALSAGQVSAAKEARELWKGMLGEVFKRVEVLALPMLDDFPATLEDAPRMQIIRSISILVNFGLVPALVLPVRTEAGLPAGLQLIGPEMSEERLLALGARVEEANGG